MSCSLNILIIIGSGYTYASKAGILDGMIDSYKKYNDIYKILANELVKRKK